MRARQIAKQLCKIWSFHGPHYEECRLLGNKDPVPTLQETLCIFATVPSRIILCKVWGFHDSDYEECRLLGYKNPVCTSQHITSSLQSPVGVRSEVFTVVTMKDTVFLDIKPSSYITGKHYVSATETNLLTLCKIWGFHDCDYEECRLLGYKTQFVHHRKHITSLLQRPTY
jgi:hypothetical protein